jgi:hypothetical protein
MHRNDEERYSTAAIQAQKEVLQSLSTLSSAKKNSCEKHE